MKSEPKRIALPLGLLCTLVGAYTAGGAAFVTFNQAEFEGLVQPGSYLETFETFIQNTVQPNSLPFTGNGFTYTLDSPGFDGDGFFVGNSGPPNGNWLSALSNQDPINASFTSGNVTAIGAEFFLIGSGLNETAGSFTIDLSDGTSQNVTTTVGNERAFVGFISTVPITSLSFAESAVTTATVALDNVHVGAAVPEPWHAGLVTALAALGFGVARRCGRRPVAQH
jgi:hypothetical protein